MDRQTDKKSDGQTYSSLDRQFDRQKYIIIIRNTNKWADKQSEGHTHSQMGMQKAKG